MTIRRNLRIEIQKLLEDHGINNPDLVDAIADTAIRILGEKRETANPVLEVVSRATGIVAIPPTEYQRIEQIHALIDHYGKQTVIDAFKWAFTKWTATRRAKGGNYSRVNFGWVDWGQDKLMEDAENAQMCKKYETKEVWVNGEMFLEKVEVKS